MKDFKSIAKKDISRLPKTTGVYCFKQKKNILYIGKAANIENRVKNHFNGERWWEKTLLRQGFGGRVGFFETGSEIEALILEANLIKKYQPKYNVMWRDDKNYFYVAVLQNKQRIPYVFITHQPNAKLKAKSWKLKADYIGPFVEGRALKKTLRFLRRALPYYTSARHPKNKCAWCHLDLCPGRPVTLGEPRPVGAGPYLNLPEYKKNIKKLILILQGKKNAVLRSLKKEMKDESKKQNFESASKIRDRIYALEQIMAHAHIINNNNKNGGFLPYGKKPHSPVLRILQKLTGAKKPISKIECYDVSNIQGKFATGSMVVFINGKPDKNQYRKFRIKFSDKPNDIAMLKEILTRRFNHNEWSYPDAILIDGGKAQLNAAIKSKFQSSNFKSNLQFQNIKILSLAKRNKELFIEGREKPVLLKTMPREIYNLILQLDDEAHRFAISYHKKLRKKSLLN